MNARAALTSFLLIALVSTFAVSVYRPHVAHSQTGTTLLSGYAWSETIGWISLSGSNYGLQMDAGGNLSGYAWSENIGWVSANSADLAGCPSSPCSAKETNGQFTGWLRALSADGHGWDGWISLSGSNYGPRENNGVISGYAWGSDVVGWIDFQYANALSPSCSLTPASQKIVRGNTANISWASTRTSDGHLDPGNMNLNPASSGTIGVQPTATTTYTATFNGPGGQTSCTATVNVSCAPVYSCSGATGSDGFQHAISYTDAGCNTQTVATCNQPSYCQAGQTTCQWPAIIEVQSGTLSGHLQARPAIIKQGDRTHLYWNIQNAQNCSVSGGGQSWSGLTSTSNGVQTNQLQQKTTYTLHCTAYQGQTDLNETLDIIVTPKFNEK